MHRHFTSDLMEFYRENQQAMQLYDVNHASRSKDLELKAFNVTTEDWDVKAQYFVRVTEYPECVTAPVINFYN